MTWTKSGDNYYDRAEIRDVGRSARLLHHEALVHCNRVLNDGRLPARDLGRLTDSEDPDGDVAELLEVGLWQPIDVEVRAGLVLPGWQVDWTDQELAEDVERRRAAETDRQRRNRAHRAGDHSLCDPKNCPVQRDEHRESRRDKGRDDTRDDHRDVTRESHRESRHPVPPVPPGPSRPEGSRDEAGDDRAPTTTTPSPTRRRCPNGEPVANDGTCCGREHPTGTTPRLRGIPGGQS